MSVLAISPVQRCSGFFGTAASWAGDTPLIKAARHGYPQLVEPLLDAGAAIDARNTMTSTALVVAASYGHLDVVRLLIKRGADVTGSEARVYESLPLFPAAQPKRLAVYV